MHTSVETRRDGPPVLHGCAIPARSGHDDPTGTPPPDAPAPAGLGVLDGPVGADALTLARVVVFEIDADATVTAVTPNIASVFGWEPDHVIGTRFFPVTARDLFTDWVDAHTGPEPYEHRAVNAAGEPRWVRGQHAAVRDADGHVRRVHSIIQDITSEVTARNHAAAAETKFRLATQAADIVTWTTADGQLDYVSGSATWYLGWSPADVRGRHHLEFVHPDDHAPVHAAADEPPQHLRVRVLAADGSWQPFTARISAVTRDGQILGRVIGLNHDPRPSPPTGT